MKILDRLLGRKDPRLSPLNTQHVPTPDEIVGEGLISARGGQTYRLPSGPVPPTPPEVIGNAETGNSTIVAHGIFANRHAQFHTIVPLPESRTMASETALTAALAVAQWKTARDGDELLAAGDAMALLLSKPATVKPKPGAPVGFTSEIKAALAVLGKVIQSQNSIPILSTVLLRAQGDKLTLIGNDLDHEVTVVVKAPGIGTWTAAPVYRDLARLIGKTRAVVTIEPAAEGPAIKVTVGGVKGTIPGYDPKDFPLMGVSMPDKDGKLPDKPTTGIRVGRLATLPASDLAALLGFVKVAISTEETRYYLNGAFLQVLRDDTGCMALRDDTGCMALRGVATDGHRLLMDQTNRIDTDVTDQPGFILPNRTVNTVLAALGDGGVDIATRVVKIDRAGKPVQPGVTHARFKTGAVTILSKVIDGAFPDYRRVIPKAPTLVIEIPRSALNEAVGNVRKASKEKAQSVKFTFGKGEVILSSKSMDGGNAEATVPVRTIAAEPPLMGPFQIGINAKYVQEAMGAFNGGVLHLGFTAASDPVLISDPALPERVGVLMPLRI